MKAQNGIRLRQRRMPPLEVPGEIFDVYQRHMGPRATLLWLNLRWLVHTNASGDIEHILQELTGMHFRDLTTGLSALVEYGLLEFAETGEYVLNEPLTAAEYERIYGKKGDGQPVAFEEMQIAAAESAAASQSTSTGGPAHATDSTVVALRSTPADTTEKSVTHKQVDEELTQSIELEAAPAAGPRQAGVAKRRHTRLTPTSAEPMPEEPLPTAEQAVEPMVEQAPPSSSPLSRKNRRRLHGQAPVESVPAPQAVKSESKPESKLRRTDGESRNADMDAVVQIYHKKIGMLGPTQFDKLRFWVEEKGMAGEVVALAIEETVQSAQNPRIQYLEGILRNWHNDGILSLQDLLKRKKASKVLSGGDDPAGASMEGVPNAAAYKRVDPDMVKKWKELYPDEYDG